MSDASSEPPELVDYVSPKELQAIEILAKYYSRESIDKRQILEDAADLAVTQKYDRSVEYGRKTDALLLIENKASEMNRRKNNWKCSTFFKHVPISGETQHIFPSE
jgi:hypothetical protein